MDHNRPPITDQPAVDFDTRPPVPVNEYDQTVRRVNVGYDLLFTLAHSFLRALRQPDLELLVVGAGGGAEIESFLPSNPDWRLTGVDPSAEMLARARARAEHLLVLDRVTLLRGTVDELPNDRRFDAAVCLFVLHFLPDEAKLTTLRGIHRRLRRRAPLIVACGSRVVDDFSLRDDYLGAWQQFGELMGMPVERMAALIQQLLSQQASASAEEEYVRLMHAAGFEHVGSVLRVMGGGMAAWLAR
jgi:tRNA (cmo5U34)-methyltransferase